MTEQNKPTDGKVVPEQTPPGKTYLRLLSFLEGDINMADGAQVHAFFIMVEDLYGNQGVIPVITEANNYEGVRKMFKRLKPFAMYAVDDDPKEVDGKRMSMDNIKEVAIADESILKGH